jgi:uncharacterized SAM-binding protein YcdF (DUF218 family)
LAVCVLIIGFVVAMDRGISWARMQPKLPDIRDETEDQRPPKDQRLPRDQRPFVGADGFAMLALSCAVLIGAAGTTLLVALIYVVWIGWTASVTESGADRIVVLGFRLSRDGQAGSLFVERLRRACAVFAGSPCAMVFVLGGRPRSAAAAEADVGAAFLLNNGIPAERVQREDRSRHTLENLRHYRDAYPQGRDVRTVLVTSRCHLARAALMARGLGLSCIGCAAATRLAMFRQPGQLLTEAFLVHWYVVGACYARWTGHQRMLGRIS